MIREYNNTDYEFLISGIIKIQKKIKMVNMPFIAKTQRSKIEMAKRFAKTLTKPGNLCFVGLNEDGRKVGISCFSRKSKNSCVFEFFFKDPDVPMNSSLIKEFKNHVAEVKRKHGFEKMYANLARRDEYEKWIYMAKKYFGAKIISSSKNSNIVELYVDD